MSARSVAPFGALLRRHRAAAHLTQEQLAARAGLSPDAIAALERGKRRTPRGATVELLASALGLDEDAREELLAVARASGAAPVSNSAGDIVPGATGSARDGIAGATDTWQLRVGPTPLVDRTHEVDMIVRLLVTEDVPLLTLVGTAGVGKTRLALEAAARLTASPQAMERFPDGIIVIDLAPVRAASQVLGAIARALGLLDVGGRTVLERLYDALGERRQLLALDNVEQVLPSAAYLLADLSAACPGLALLVTSRVPLRLRRERILRVAPLPVPDPSGAALTLDELVTFPSVALFVERAGAHRADFALSKQNAAEVAQLAAQLDGLPLALELAAARLDVLPLTTIVHHLDDRLRLLRWEAADLPERQRSLEAAVGWSYDLLTDSEQQLFRHLGVFVGRVSPAAISSVIGGVAANEVNGAGDERETQAHRKGEVLDMLIALAERSLILPAALAGLEWQTEWPDTGERGKAEGEEGSDDEGGTLAFGMLETVREYAQERLATAGELEAAQRAHARYFLALAEQAEPHLRSRDQRVWYLRLEREHDNLRAALRWLLDQDDAADRTAGLRLAVALGYFWRFRGYHGEGARWLDEALARAPIGEGADQALRIQALVEAGALLAFQGAIRRARVLLDEGLTLARQQQDSSGATKALIFLGMCELFAGHAAEATLLQEEALRSSQALGDSQLMGNALYFLGATAQAQGKNSQASEHYAEALALAEAIDDMRGAATIHIALAPLMSWQGKNSDLPVAAHHLHEGLAASVTLQDRWLLSLAAQATLLIVSKYVDPASQARLQGAVNTLRRATGAGAAAWEQGTKGRGASGRREQLDSPEKVMAYHEGRSLSMDEVAALVKHLLEAVAQSHASPGFISPRNTAQQSPPIDRTTRSP